MSTPADENVIYTAGVVAPPPIIYAAGFALGLMVGKVTRIPDLPNGLLRYVGGLKILAGLALGAWTISTMHRAGTPVIPTQPTRALVITGPFRFSRNPIYLGMASVYVGLALLIGRLGPLITLPGVLAVVESGVVEREERYLEQRFGDEYAQFRGSVHRWL